MIKSVLRTFLRRKSSAAQFERLEIPISSCVHYSGFRYGVSQFNPLEYSARDHYKGIPILNVRRQFVNFLQYYRPSHLGEALGIDLLQNCPLWAYPWRNLSESDRKSNFGWLDRPEDIEDIITHFSSAGILGKLIDQEFFWQEQALMAIMEHGYRPEKYSYAYTLELRRNDQCSAHILLDGNHRVSALSAMGHKSLIVIRDKKSVIFESRMHEWPEVSSGMMSIEDAHNIFHAYFQGNHCWRTTRKAANIIASDAWKNLYLNNDSE